MIPNNTEPEAPKRPVRVLHLEDSPADQALVRMTLRRARVPHEIRQVDSLQGLARCLDSETFDVIVADYRLTGFTAIDAWQLVSARPGHPPLVLLSGAIGEAAAVDAMRLGFADYLLKDDMARLPHVIERALEVAEARRAREQAVADLAESEQLRGRFGLPVYGVDERYSTTAALEDGARDADAGAACIILEQFLRSLSQ